MFECYQSDISRQFEVIQSRWIDDGDPFGVGDDGDPIVGPHASGAGKMTIQGRPAACSAGRSRSSLCAEASTSSPRDCARCAGCRLRFAERPLDSANTDC